MARLIVVVLNLKPQILISDPGERDLRRYARSIAEAVSEGKISSSDDPLRWLRGRSIKISPAPALLAFAAFLLRFDVNVSIDKALFELSPDERTKAKDFLAGLNPPGPERIPEELLRLNDYLYLKELEAKEGNAIVILSSRPRGNNRRLEEFRIIELDFLDDPVNIFRRAIEGVPFQICVKFHELTQYNTEEVLAKFWHQLQKIFATMQRHLHHLFHSGAKPKSRSQPRLELISLSLDGCKAEQLPEKLPQPSSSLCPIAQSLSNELKSLQDYLSNSVQVFTMPATEIPSLMPYLQQAQGLVFFTNPSPVPAINLQVEYLDRDKAVIGMFEAEILRGNETKELDGDFVVSLKAQGVAFLRMRQTGQTLQLL